MLENVTVMGACGQMGSGISLLIAQEILKIKLEGKGTYKLNLIDVNEPGFNSLLNYIVKEGTKTAESNINWLREVYQDKDLVENEDYIRRYVDNLKDVITIRGSDLELAKGSKMVFEATFENEFKKIDLLIKMKEICDKDAVYFTNTSSIPIASLNDGANLNGRIIGYHFYNPPAVQRLIELISAESTLAELTKISKELAKRLGKQVFEVKDVAGFAGNGHFMRECLYAISEAERLVKDGDTFPGAIYKIDHVTKRLLIRPMGIFQLMDYVKVGVCRDILEIMNKYIQEDLHSSLIDKVVEQEKTFYSKDGILDPLSGRYALLKVGEKDTEWVVKAKEELGAVPKSCLKWNPALAKDPKLLEKLVNYYQDLKASNMQGAKIAVRYLEKSYEIAEKLVNDKVIVSMDVINGILKTGFYHLYGPGELIGGKK
jgi:3-hydroxyacyl-CoA dehydrogenase